MKFEVAMHSFVDLITNSSTEIYIDYSESVKPFKEMVNEMLNVFGEGLTCDDIFEVTAKVDVPEDEFTNWEKYYESIEDLYESYEETNPKLLIIEVKDEKYTKLAKKIKSFLESGEEKEFLA